jgi:hypothetical protein
MARIRMLLLLVSLLPAGIAIAEVKDVGSWDGLKEIRAGDKIEVIDQNLKSYRGTFVSVSDEAISLRSKKDTFTVERANVLRVSVRDSGKRTRRMLLGAAIGAGAALAITVPIQVANSNEGNDIAGIMAGATAGAAGAGLAIGSTMGNRTVYRAEKTKDAGREQASNAAPEP